MFAADGLSGPVGRGFLLVGVVAALFGALASITAARTGDKNVSKLIPRFAILLVVAAAGAFAAMEYAMRSEEHTSELQSH